jgi:malate dehydrogenase (oxaloacetate-decarboxylating)
MPAPNASYSITMRVQLDADPGGIGRLTTAVEQAAGTVTAVDVVESHPDRMVVDLTCNVRDTDHAEQTTKAVDRLDGVETRNVSRPQPCRSYTCVRMLPDRDGLMGRLLLRAGSPT